MSAINCRIVQLLTTLQHGNLHYARSYRFKRSSMQHIQYYLGESPREAPSCTPTLAMKQQTRCNSTVLLVTLTAAC